MDKKLLIAALVAVAGIVLFSQTQGNQKNAFEEWKANYGANWGVEEESFRKMVFQKNLAIIEKHNADQTQTYKMAINQFTVLTDEEFFKIYLDPKPIISVEKIEDESFVPNADIDWVAQGKVSPVKNQGSCGSCWAFSATGVIESWAIMKGKTVSLSEQQLVDCSRSLGNQGCNGGWPNRAIQYIQSNGIASSSEYPYVARDQACAKNGGNFKIPGQQSASGCTGMQNALQKRPLSVTVDATNWSKYGSGVFSNCAASINHAVLLVGIVGGNWKIKNSWGTGWGQQGFIRLAGTGSTCGVCNYAAPYIQ